MQGKNLISYPLARLEKTDFSFGMIKEENDISGFFFSFSFFFLHFPFSDRVLALSPRLEYSGAITAHRSLKCSSHLGLQSSRDHRHAPPYSANFSVVREMGCLALLSRLLLNSLASQSAAITLRA